MLGDTERNNVSDFFHDDEEFDLFSAALYFQKSLIFNAGFDHVVIRMNEDEGDVCYSITVREEQEFVRQQTGESDGYDSYFYLVVYRDYLNIQTAVDLQLFQNDADMITQRAEALKRRAGSLKGMERAVTDRELLFYSWIPLEYNFDSPQMAQVLKEHLWFFEELHKYIKTLSAGREAFSTK